MTRLRTMIARGAGALAGITLMFATTTGVALARPSMTTMPAADLEALCRPESVQAVVTKLASTKVTIKEVKTVGAPNLPGGTKFTAATNELPAFCQVSGSFVTNASVGKTANFLATFPATWNGKFLQLGCSGQCGNFFVSNVATPAVTVTTQGNPGDIIRRGYASFATDEGHESAQGPWATKSDGTLDEEAAQDFFYRADKVLAAMGKEFSVAFYRAVKHAPRKVARSYFIGCSGGGRDAYVAASFFPEEYDGIIGGSPYLMSGTTLSNTAAAVAGSRSPGGRIPPALGALANSIVKAKCDELDGMKDGLMQNPHACNFRPDRDLPRCEGDVAGAQCFTKAQIETVSVRINAITDEQGNVVVPGFSVSDMQVVGGGGPPGGGGVLGGGDLKTFVYRNDPNFVPSALFTFREGGPGQVQGFHAVIPAAEAARIKAAMKMGTGDDPADAARLIKQNRKLMLWTNFSDNTLDPNMSVNYYKKLAKLQGGYDKLQKNVRLFMLPGTDHCSITSIAPNGFDALGAMEDWVEKQQAPDQLIGRVAKRQFSPGASGGAAQEHPNWTMPLCKFPEMARYSGKGDVKDAANWSCPAKDTGLLQVGDSGREAGVIE
jgi:feruloyl esterase